MIGLLLLLTGIGCLSFVVVVYGSYLRLVLRSTKRKEYLEFIDRTLERDLSDEPLPRISVIVPAYNEERAIRRKLLDIQAFDYPHDKIEVILIDDCSTDATYEIAQQAFNQRLVSGEILRNTTRLGANACFVKGFAEAAGDLILMTDVDVSIESDSITKGVKLFRQIDSLGGITGRLVPVSSRFTAPVKVEESYRKFFDSMGISESAIHSTYPGNGPFILVNRHALPEYPTGYGTTDANLALGAIRRGLRFLYVPKIIFYEEVSSTIRDQLRQKIRRAARVVRCLIANGDMLFNGRYGRFGKTIFPLKFGMMVVCPILFLGGLLAVLLEIMYLSVGLGLFLGLVFALSIYLGTLGFRGLSTLSTFVLHQFYLFVGLCYATTNPTKWNPVKRSEQSDLRVLARPALRDIQGFLRTSIEKAQKLMRWPPETSFVDGLSKYVMPLRGSD